MSSSYQLNLLGEPKCSADSDEWYSPRAVIEMARDYLGDIDLDPFSCVVAQQVVKAKTYYTINDDAHQYEWHGRIYMNPPYSKGNLDRAVDRFNLNIEAGRIPAAVVVVNASFSKAWHKLARHASSVLIPEGRFGFWNPSKDGAGNHYDQTVLFYGGLAIPESAHALGRVFSA